MPSEVQLRQMLEVYAYPSQAFWRAFELDVLSRVALERPIMELGCGDGGFTRNVCGTVDLGIDINPRAVERAAKTGTFAAVRLQDARQLEDQPAFRTILANSVLEHILDIDAVLAGCFRALEPRGKLITTVPLLDMNAGMALSSPAWIRYRQNRLSHVNLWPLQRWREALEQAGFRVTQTERYLSPRQIRLWDQMDGPAVIGTRRINVGSMSRRVAEALPESVQGFLNSFWTRFLRSSLSDQGSQDGCCALIAAEKPYLNGLDASVKGAVGDASSGTVRTAIK